MSLSKPSRFGLAEAKPEGGKLGPHTYLHMNGRLPPKSFYTPEELAKQAEEGYTDDDYKKE